VSLQAFWELERNSPGGSQFLAGQVLVAREVEAYPLLNNVASNKGMQLTKRGLSSCRSGETGWHHSVALRS
jgi:hypothetical protein